MEPSLDDVLNGVEPEVVEETSTPEPEETPQDTKGEEEPKAEEPPSSEDTKEPWTKTAYLDEKRKRQALERQLEESKKEQPKAPDIFESQDQYTQYIQNEVSFAVNNTKASMSEYFARREHADLDEKFEKFQAMVEDNPELKVQVSQAASPWHEMYDIVVKAEKFDKLQDVDKYEAEIRAGIEKKVREELEAKYKGESQKLDSITPSLAGKRSAGDSKDPINQSLEDILGR